MATPKKTLVNINEHNRGILQKLWIVGQPLEDYPEGKVCLNYIGVSNDPKNHNEKRTCGCYSSPKYFTNFAEARSCAKFWNEKIPWEFDETRRAYRHGMNCAFKPHLVKITIA